MYYDVCRRISWFWYVLKKIKEIIFVKIIWSSDKYKLFLIGLIEYKTSQYFVDDLKMFFKK